MSVMGIDSKVTVLVSSCDAYSDLWEPFFRLMNIYGGILKECRIVLNTESKTYSYDGLNIVCLEFYKDSMTNAQWGARLRKHIELVETPYIIHLLDDFFLSNYVDSKRILRCIEWMDADDSIGAMNFLPIERATKESKYKGFALVNPGTPFRVNTQAGLWRKEVLYNSILEDEDPYTYEIFGNIRNDAIMRSNIYALLWGEREPIPYGYYEYDIKDFTGKTKGFSAINGGKWNLRKVEENFKKNNIKIDYSERGVNNYFSDISPFVYKIVVLLRNLEYNLFKKKENEIIYKEKYKQYVEPYLRMEKF